MLSERVLEAARLTASSVNNEANPFWLGGKSALEVTFPQFAASESPLDGAGGTLFQVLRVTSAGEIGGLSCLYGKGVTGAQLVLSLYTELSPGSFVLCSSTSNLAAGAGAGLFEVGGRLRLPGRLAGGDVVVAALSWTAVGSGAGPVLGCRAAPVGGFAPYGSAARSSSVTVPPASFSFTSLPVSAVSPWIGLCR